MVAESAGTEDTTAEAGLDVLRLTDEVIGLSAEVAELRAQLDVALARATSAAEVAQSAEVAALAAAEQTTAFGEYLGEVTAGLGARAVAPGESGDPVRHRELETLTRDELVARVEALEAVLDRRSVQVALGVTKKLRGS